MKNTKENFLHVFGLTFSSLVIFAGLVFVLLSSCSEDLKTIIKFGAIGCLLLILGSIYIVTPSFSEIKNKRKNKLEAEEYAAKVKAERRKKIEYDCNNFVYVANTYSSWWND